MKALDFYDKVVYFASATEFFGCIETSAEKTAYLPASRAGNVGITPPYKAMIHGTDGIITQFIQE